MNNYFRLTRDDFLLKKFSKRNKIKNEFLTLNVGTELMFYVECKGNTKSNYVDRIHLEKLSKETLIIEIDKGSDGGTYSKVIKISQVDNFFQNIYEYIDIPEKYGCTYEQW